MDASQIALLLLGAGSGMVLTLLVLGAQDLRRFISGRRASRGARRSLLQK